MHKLAARCRTEWKILLCFYFNPFWARVAPKTRWRWEEEGAMWTFLNFSDLEILCACICWKFFLCSLAVTKQLHGCLALQICVCLFEAVYSRSGTKVFFCLIVWADIRGQPKFTQIHLIFKYCHLVAKSWAKIWFTYRFQLGKFLEQFLIHVYWQLA